MIFEEIIGHDHIKKILCKSIQENRVAHAYLFFGPKGVGKKSLAESFAIALLCEDKPGWGCGTCNICHKVANRNFPDIVHVTLESGSSIKIEQIRELHKKMQYKPYEGKRKICIIEDAAALTRDAANSLLKLLEEPPSDTIFILVAVNQYQVIPTILSRCQIIQVGKVATPLIEKLLIKKGLSDKTAKLFATLSDGIPEIGLELSNSDQSSEMRTLVFRGYDVIERQDLTEILSFVEELEKREGVQNILEYLMLFYRDCLMWQTTKSQKFIINIDKMDIIQNSQRTKQYYLQAINDIMETKSKINQNVGMRLALEVLFLKLSEESGQIMA